MYRYESGEIRLSSSDEQFLLIIFFFTASFLIGRVPLTAYGIYGTVFSGVQVTFIK